MSTYAVYFQPTEPDVDLFFRNLVMHVWIIPVSIADSKTIWIMELDLGCNAKNSLGKSHENNGK